MGDDGIGQGWRGLMKILPGQNVGIPSWSFSCLIMGGSEGGARKAGLTWVGVLKIRKHSKY